MELLASAAASRRARAFATHVAPAALLDPSWLALPSPAIRAARKGRSLGTGVVWARVPARAFFSGTTQRLEPFVAAVV